MRLNRLNVTFNVLKLRVELKACLKLAIPLVGVRLAEVGVTTTDTIFMAGLGHKSLAAGALGVAVFSFLLIICVGTITAISSLIAEAYGSQKDESIKIIIAQCFWVLLSLSLPITFLIWNIAPFLKWCGQEINNVAIAETYLRAIIWGFPAVLAFQIGGAVISALSFPQPILIISLINIVFNIFADYILGFGKLGFPKMGLPGIGWASTISYWLMLLSLIVYVLHQQQLKIYHLFRNWRFNKLVFQNIFKIGVPVGIIAALETGLFTAISLLMGQIGTDTLAAHQLVAQTSLITYMIPGGIARATAIRVSHYLEQPQKILWIGYVALGLGITFMFVSSLIFWKMPEKIISLYLKNNPDNFNVKQIAISLFQVAAAFQVFDAIQIISAGALRGLKDTQIPMLLSFFTYWFIGLGSGYILGTCLQLGGVGYWWGLTIGFAATGLVLTYRFQKLVNCMTQKQKVSI
ncbi:MATE family efflux transporter [Mastigocladus laminosus UU774]|nr:MATE family efflux transporter [Mastigocladus laminosus UU774]BAZ70832.1 multi-drug efflux transporter [Fischerella sp. NIES-4106]